MYERILVPTDGSDVAERAVDHALSAAERREATVHALYVVDIEAVSLSLGTEQLDRLRTGDLTDLPEAEAAANAATGVVAERARERGLDAVEEIAVGRPHEAIADYAADNDVDLVVMGSHGRAGVERAVLGSVTERVLRASTRPVLVVDAEGES